MKKPMRAALIAIFLVLFPSQIILAGVIDFEDLYDANVMSQGLPEGYGGFSWSANVQAINTNDFFPGNNWKNGTLGNVSIFGGFNAGTYPVSLSKSTPGFFDFESAYLTSAYAESSKGESLTVLIEGWRQGEIIPKHSTTVVITDIASKFHFDFDQIDTLWFIPEAAVFGPQIVVDDIGLSSVPEPSSFVLLGFGLLLFAGKYRERRYQA